MIHNWHITDQQLRLERSLEIVLEQHRITIKTKTFLTLLFPIWSITFIGQTDRPLSDVRYLSTGFEYFLSRFAGSLAPMAPTMVPSRTRRALSVPYFAFFLSPPPRGGKSQKLWKNHEKPWNYQYYRSRFVWQLAKLAPMMVPNRTRRALSTMLFPLLQWLVSKCLKS